MRCLECIYCERFDLRTSPPTVICSSHNAPINIHLGCRNGKNKLAPKKPTPKYSFYKKEGTKLVHQRSKH